MLKARIQTAIVLVVGLLYLLLQAPPLLVSLVFSVVVALGAWEWAGLMAWRQPWRLAYGLLIFALCGVAARFDLAKELWLFSALFWLLVCPFWLYFHWALVRRPVWAVLIGALLLVPTWSSLVHLYSMGVWSFLGVVAIVWVADIAAYFTGRAFGKRKLAPAISPGKSWEGVLGAIVAVIVYGVVVLPALGFVPVHSTMTWLLFVGFLVVLTMVSVMGDLFESLIKRQAGAKDSSQLLPGHGGILDRVDSLTSSMPLFVLLISLF